jgi:hypothetical protein
MRFIRWLAVLAMLSIGIGAVYLATFGLAIGAATPTTALTSAARQTTVSQEIAATGSVSAPTRSCGRPTAGGPSARGPRVAPACPSRGNLR